MNHQILKILEEHEETDFALYQSFTSWETMIFNDFWDAEHIMSCVPQHTGEMTYFLQPSAVPARSDDAVIPVRKCDAFYAKKHTRTQIPYFHSHDFYELIYVLQGSSQQMFRHTQAPLCLREKQLCLICPGAVHSMSRSGMDDIILKFSIPRAMFETLDIPAPELHGNELVTVFDQCSPKAEFFIDMLFIESNLPAQYSDVAIKSYLSLLFIELHSRSQYQFSQLLSHITEYFHAHMPDVTLRGFASSAGYSDSYMGKLIKKQTGKSFQDWIVALKMDRAAELLVDTDMPVTEIAYTLGYANVSGLQKQFYRVYFMTPREFRASRRKIDGSGNN